MRLFRKCAQTFHTNLFNLSKSTAFALFQDTKRKSLQKQNTSTSRKGRATCSCQMSKAKWSSTKMLGVGAVQQNRSKYTHLITWQGLKQRVYMTTIFTVIPPKWKEAGLKKERYHGSTVDLSQSGNYWTSNTRICAPSCSRVSLG